jgi:hypothetical protein
VLEPEALESRSILVVRCGFIDMCFVHFLS